MLSQNYLAQRQHQFVFAGRGKGQPTIFLISDKYQMKNKILQHKKGRAASFHRRPTSQIQYIRCRDPNRSSAET
jgi:hypothetical protein